MCFLDDSKDNQEMECPKPSTKECGTRLAFLLELWSNGLLVFIILKIWIWKIGDEEGCKLVKRCFCLMGFSFSVIKDIVESAKT